MTKSIQILQMTQVSIINSIKALALNPKRGDVGNYDISITKTGDGKESRYSVLPSVPTPVAPEITQARLDAKVDLNALFE
jgi:hypothetical protein